MLAQYLLYESTHCGNKEEKMKKKLSLTIVSLMCLGVLGLQSCGETTSNTTTTSESASETTSEATSETTSVVEEVVYTAVSITNKEELQATWLEEEADRTVDLSVEPTANTLALLNDGTIVITSSDSSVISVSGKKLTAVAAGTATITVTLTDGDTVLTDSVELTVEAAAAPLTIAEVRALESGALAKTRGYITKIMGDNSFAIIADGETSIELYGFYDYAGLFEVGDLVLTSGTYSPYNGLSEIGSLTSVEKIEAADNADVLAPVDLQITDWSAIPTGNDCRIVNVEGMVFTGLGAADSKGNFYIYLTLNDVAVSCYVSYHNAAEDLAAIYALFEATPLTSVVDFNGLLSIYSTYQLSPMSVDEFTITEAELTEAQSLELLQNEIGTLDYSAGVYAIDDLPVADTLGSFSVAYAVSSELTDVVAIDAATGVVTVTDVYAAATGTITATITDSEAAVQGEPIVINVTISASAVEPAAVAATLSEVIADESGNGAVKFTGVEATASDIVSSKYGNMNVTSGEETIAIYGSTATDGAIKFNAHSETGNFYFSNPKDFLTNEFTSALKDTDVITFDCIRADYNGTAQINAYITEINGVSTVPAVTSSTLTSSDFTGTSTDFYKDATATVDGVEFLGGYVGVNDAAFIQMKDGGAGKISSISNTTATPTAIDSITLNFNVAKSTYDIAASAFVLATSSSVITDVIDVSTEGVLANGVVSSGDGSSYTYTFDVDQTAGDTFFKLSRDGSYTSYVDSIVINYVG